MLYGRATFAPAFVQQGEIVVSEQTSPETIRQSRLAASNKYVPELDGIRAIAISFVVAAHYRLVPHVPGAFGVTLFFFLSGYLITTLFFSEFRSYHSIDIQQFYIRRWLRLTPPLIISVIIGVAFPYFTRNAVAGTATPIGTTMAALFYYTNYYDLAWLMDPARVIPFGICWSLAVEEHFYLVWPWVIRKSIHNPRILSIVIVCICAAVLVWRCCAHFVFLLPVEYTGMASDCRIDSILFGALMRTLLETPWADTFIRILRGRPSRLAAALALLLTFIIRDQGFRETLRYSIQGLALMPFFVEAVAGSRTSIFHRALASSPMVIVGKMSYSIYLFHLLARTPGEVYFGSPFSLAATFSGLFITGVVAFLLYIGVERPMARVRHRLGAHRQSVFSEASSVAATPPLVTER